MCLNETGYTANKEHTDHVKPIDLNLIVNCLICSSLMKEPTTMHCGHSFCKWCITKWCLEYRKRTCPVCRQELDSTVPGVNISLKFLIDSLQINKIDQEIQQEEESAQIEEYKQLTSRTSRLRRSVSNLVDHRKLIKKITASLGTNDNTYIVDVKSTTAASSTDSCLSRLDLINLPVYLFLTLWGFVCLFALDLFKRLLK